ncbi:unnamed protein product [Prorocentrum cordatum]|uniref:Uncharacterized protein n=1 Tax=Prorocentrum cordatum TaxID=2364126 RepID=A0ABN9TPN1_9DINO|nr:unnamed protein product [Polarella glacialis]
MGCVAAVATVSAGLRQTVVKCTGRSSSLPLSPPGPLPSPVSRRGSLRVLGLAPQSGHGSEMFRFPFGVVIRLVSKTFKLRRPPRARGWGHGEGRDPPTAPQGRGPAAGPRAVPARRRLGRGPFSTPSTVEAQAEEHPACLQGALGFALGFAGAAMESGTLPRHHSGNALGSTFVAGCPFVAYVTLATGEAWECREPRTQPPGPRRCGGDLPGM